MIAGRAAAFALLGAACLPDALQAQQTVTFRAADGVTVYADHFAGPSAAAPLILLFHQAGANGRAEYATIAPRLVDAGFGALVVDLRSGGDRFGGENRTVAALDGAKEYGYCDAYPDLSAALDWALSRGATRIFAWGSSYSAALVVRLGAERTADLAGVLVFSPASGEPMEGCDPAGVIDRVRVPMLALRPANEMELPAVAAQLERFRAAGADTHVASPGSHGSSMLVPSRVNGDVEATWTAVLAFLREH